MNMNKELFTIGSSGSKCVWAAGDAESSIRDAEIARCVDESGDDCSGFERGNPASCPTSCDYTAPNAAINCYIGGPPEPEPPLDLPAAWQMGTGSVTGMTTGTCPSPFAFIDTRAECDNAANELGLDDTIAAAGRCPRGTVGFMPPGRCRGGDLVTVASSDRRGDHPYGCYFDRRPGAGWLVFNDAGDRNNNDQNRVSICKNP